MIMGVCQMAVKSFGFCFLEKSKVSLNGYFLMLY